MSISLIIKESFHTGLAKRLWAYFAIIGILAMLLSSIANLPSDIINNSIGAELQQKLVGLNASEDPALLLQIFTDYIGIIFQNILLIAFGFLISIILGMIVSVLLNGMGYNGVKNFLLGKRGISDLLQTSFNQTKPRIFTAFFVSLLLGIISLIVFAIAFVPIGLELVSQVQNIITNFSVETVLSPEKLQSTLIPIMALANIAISIFLVLFLIEFLLTPILIFIYPIIFFEKHGVIDTLKKAVFLGTKNYFGNLLFIIVLNLAIFLSFLVVIFSFFISIIFIPLLLLWFPFVVVYIFWLTSFTHLAIIKYYDFVSGNKK